MLPQIKSGDYVLLLSWPVIFPRPGNQVIFTHPLYGTLIKTVVKIKHKQKTFSTQGLNPLSVTSENLKNIPLSRLNGIVILTFTDKISVPDSQSF